MFGIAINVDADLAAKISTAVDKAAFRNFGHAAARIRKDARASIKPAPKEQRRRAKKKNKVRVRRSTHAASLKGQPPHTQRGQLRNAIVYDASKEGAIIGPRASVVGESARPHEHGGEYKGADYPERPFMGPALEANLDRMVGDWASSVGQ